MKICLTSIGLITAMCAALAVAGCASKPTSLETNDRTLAAQAEVKTEENSNGNTELQLSVRHLAKPEIVSEKASTYVVWAQPTRGDGGPVQNLGRLNLNDNLEGRFEAITPFKEFDLFITAEPIATVNYPTGYKALWTHVSE